MLCIIYVIINGIFHIEYPLPHIVELTRLMLIFHILDRLLMIPEGIV